jgi:pimeloyl-ACP methyl ester carboxylesterase
VTAPAVLLLHGQPGTGADWAGVRRALEPRFQVVVPDRPGYGNSDGAAGGFEHNARAMVELLDRLGLERAVVAGHSWGAGVALAMGERHPERVSAIAMVCPVVPGEPLGAVDRALAGRRTGPVVARAGFFGAGVALASPRLRRRVERTLPGSDPERLGEVAREWRSGRAWRSFWIEQRALFSDLPALEDDIAALAVPTTVVVGTRDRVTSPDAARRFAAGVGARIVEVPGSGHLLPMQRPAEVAAAIASAVPLTSE